MVNNLKDMQLVHINGKEDFQTVFECARQVNYQYSDT